jgi:hypothetical protein
VTVHVLGAIGALHTTTTAGATRVCSRHGCETEFAPREAKHRFCSQACRNAQWKVDHGYTDRRAANPSRNGSARQRRARPVRVRPTLTLDEARALVRFLRRIAPDELEVGADKIAAALEREEARHG